MLTKSLAAFVDYSFNLIRFTLGLLPNNIAGISIFNQTTSQFEFQPWPVLQSTAIGTGA